MSLVKLFTKGITLEPQASDPSSPVEGQLQYADGTSRTEGLWQYKNSAWSSIGSGSSGGIDFLLLGDAESGTTGWSSYKDAVAILPEDGTGGSITGGHTFTTSSSSPLNGTNSFVLAKPASNCRGEGHSKDMTIPLGYATRAIVWQGIYSTDANYVDDDYIVYFYDVTNSALIQPTPYLIKANSYGTLRAEMQIPASCTSLRAIIHCATTSATTRSLKFDDMTIGPSKQARGVVETDWITYPSTPTLVGFGTPTSVEFFYKKRGQDLFIRGKFTSGTSTATEARIPLPPGLTTASSTIIPSISVVGYGSRSVTVGDTQYTTLMSAGLTYLTMGRQDGGAPGLVSTNGSSLLSSGDAYSFETWAIPIAGWSSNQVVSEDYGARLVACRASMTAAQTAVSGTVKVAYNTTASATYQGYDTTASFDTTNNRFVVPESGYYECKAQVYMSAVSAGTQCLIEIRKTGTAFCKSYERDNGGTDFTAEVRGRVYAVKGDYFEVYTNGDASFNIGAGASGDLDNFEIIKESGNQQIAASEIIACSYTTSVAQAVTDGNTIVYGTKVYDTHAAFNASTGVFTAPRSGYYRIGGSARTASFVASVGAVFGIIAEKAGSSTINRNSRLDICEVASSRGYTASVDAEFYLIKGDTLEISFNESLAAVNLSGSDADNYINISSVGGVA